MKSSAMPPARESAREAPFWLAASSYWLPKHLPTSAWWTHSPFAAWITDVLRPRRVVELGSHFGFSTFAFAEAAKRLGHDMTVFALDSWVGDDHAGFYGEDVYAYVEAITREDYPDVVQLVRGWFIESRPRFADASVDLLHIDGRHAYEDVLADYSEWRSVVRDGGVILIHDIAERENGFGVYRLWDEIAEPGRSFAFEHGHGLGILAVGEPTSPGLRALLAADDATAGRVRADFERLGRVVARQAWLETLPMEVDQLRAAVASIATRVDHLSEEVNRRAEHIAAMEASTSWWVTAPLRAIGARIAQR